MAKNDGDQRVLATAQHIVRTLGKNEHMTEDMLRILSTFDDRFSNINDFINESHNPAGPSISNALKKMEESLDYAEEIIMRWENPGSEDSMIWESQPQEAITYVKAVDELQTLMRPLSAPWSDKALLDRAQRVLETAVLRLKKEFKYMVIMNSEAVDSEWLLSCTSETVQGGYGNDDDQSGVTSESSDDDNDNEDIPIAHPVTDFTASFDPIPMDRVKDLNFIAQCMARAGFVAECSQVYVNVRKTVLEQSLYRLGLERPNPEGVQKMSWEMLEVKIRKWIQAFKVAVKVIFAAEKSLCDKVFNGLNSVPVSAFTDLALGSMMQFLAFAKAVSFTRRTPEKLFKILDMYELIKELMPDISSIFYDTSLRAEVRGVLTQLGEAARGTLQEFETAIQRDASKTPVPGGSFHPLTRYVMNYMKFLIDYTSSLEELLRDRRREVPRSLGVEAFGLADGLLENSSSESETHSPLAVQVMWLIVHLESNLEGKSKLYMDPAMSYLFLMNNVHYIVQKVKQSELSALLGNSWLRKHSGQVRAYAKSYVITAWKKVFAFLTDDDLTANGRLPSDISRFAIKDRLKNFNITFEEVCASQRAALVPDMSLKQELRIAIAEKLIPAYRTFTSRFGNYLEAGRQPERFLKYTPDDLENYVLDLFDGPA